MPSLTSEVEIFFNMTPSSLLGAEYPRLTCPGHDGKRAALHAFRYRIE
jgi:hypothetical protein